MASVRDLLIQKHGIQEYGRMLDKMLAMTKPRKEKK